MTKRRFMDGNQPPNVSEAYLEALRHCRRPRPLDLGRDSRGAGEEVLPPPAASIKTQGDTFATAAGDLELVTELKDGWEICFDNGEDRFLGSWWGWNNNDGSGAWESIQVGEFWERQGHTYNGTAMYRVRFTVPEPYKGRQLWLVLGGLKNQCHLYFNQGWVSGRYGQSAGDGPVTLSLGDPNKVKFGQENVLAVYVNNTRGPGGLWKPVWIAASRKE